MARVWSYSQRKDGELLVMLALADFANDAGESWPSIPVLAAKARLTDRQTRRVLTKLETAGEVRRVKSNGGRNRRNHYFITVSENPDIITGKELQGKNNPVIGDTKTLTPMSGALNRHRTVNSAARKKRAQPKPQNRDSRVKEYIDWFCHEYQNRHGRRYHVNGGKNGELVKRLLATFDLPTLKRCALALFESDDDFLCRTDKGIGILANQINKLAGMIEQAEPAAKPSAPKPEPLDYGETANGA
jgi:hypothetical protein